MTAVPLDAGSRRLLPFLLLPILMVAACSDPAAPPPSVVLPEEGEAIFYSKHIQPIFSTSCGGSDCHAGNSAASGLRLDSWESVTTGSSDYGSVVVPYAAARSHFFQHINTDTTLGPIALPHMPLGRDPLPREQILAIRRWIAEGAKNDAGDVPLGDPSRPRLYVGCQSEDLVAIIDVATRRLARYLPVGSRDGGDPEAPHNVTLSPDGRSLYVVLVSAGVMEKYDATTLARLGSVATGASPTQAVLTPDSRTIFVSNFDLTGTQRFITVVDAATMRTTDTIFDVGLAPHGVQLTPQADIVVTTNALSDNLSLIDVATHEILATIPASPGAPLPPGAKAQLEPYQGEFTSDGRWFWFTCRGGSQVRLVDMSERRVVDSVPVARRPLIPAMHRERSELWVPCSGADQVDIIDMGSRAVIGSITGMKTQPHAVGFSADGATAFVACENQTGVAHHPTSGTDIVPGIVYVVDVATRSVIRQIEVAGFAAGLAIGG